jgi:hypothetical protein
MGYLNAKREGSAEPILGFHMAIIEDGECLWNWSEPPLLMQHYGRSLGPHQPG